MQSTQRKSEDSHRVHRADAITKDLAQLQVPGVNAVALAQKVFNGLRAFIVNDRRRDVDHYDDDDGDWATDEVFTPEERYFAFPVEFKHKSWEQIQELVTEGARAFLSSPKGKASFLAAAQAVSVGFDDGDLVKIA
jgi:hypothetical protein